MKELGEEKKMSALIEEFKREHSEIMAILAEVKEHGIFSREGQAKLMSVRASLLEHLWNENERLYPVLWKEAEHNNDLKKVLDVFAVDMENVSRIVQEFFDKYLRDVLGKEVLEEFESLFVALCNRIKNEEDILYDEYDKIKQQ